MVLNTRAIASPSISELPPVPYRCQTTRLCKSEPHIKLANVNALFIDATPKVLKHTMVRARGCDGGDRETVACGPNNGVHAWHDTRLNVPWGTPRRVSVRDAGWEGATSRRNAGVAVQQCFCAVKGLNSWGELLR